MQTGQRRRIESTCNLFCFRDCQQNSDKNTAHTQAQQARPDKISLKKILESDPVPPIPTTQRFQRSISHKILQPYKCDTNRSKQSQKQMKQSMLFRKKAKIQFQIQEVNKQMSRLTVQFGQKISQLKKIREQLKDLQDP